MEGDPYGVLCDFVSCRGYREWLAAPPVIDRSSLRDAGEEIPKRSGGESQETVVPTGRGGGGAQEVWRRIPRGRSSLRDAVEEMPKRSGGESQETVVPTGRG